MSYFDLDDISIFPLKDKMSFWATINMFLLSCSFFFFFFFCLFTISTEILVLKSKPKVIALIPGEREKCD